MFVVVGRFRFRPMGADERQRMMQQWEKDFVPLARQSPGFRGVHFTGSQEPRRTRAERLDDDPVVVGENI